MSVEMHGSKLIGVVGHHDCAGNPVDDSVHLAHIRSAIKTVASWGFSAEVFGIWFGEHWNVDNEIHV